MTTTNRTTSKTSPGAILGTRRLMKWYRDCGRHTLPWRQTRDRYAILVSEVMLQQTQVRRVVPYWLAWMDRWPDVPALAGATRADVIRAWAGLGYNSRAVRLHQAAQVCVERHEGAIPASPAAMRALPGVGAYTADAVLCFSGTLRVIPLDTNVSRVLARSIHGVARAHEAPPGALSESASTLTPARRASDRAAALMDLGALLCTASAPRCSDCPLAPSCAWRVAGCPETARKEAASERFEHTARWARGRIVALVREGPVAERRVREALPRRHADCLERYIETLARDGLIERRGDLLLLSGDQAMNMASPKL
jgi:A/G-specific adenine glycosylase